MSWIIEDGTGQGHKAKVTAENRLYTHSLAIPVQAHISENHQQAFQVCGQIDIADSEKVILFLKNDDPDRKAVITYIRIMSAGAADLNKDAYFSIKMNGIYSSGGTAVTPVNMSAGSNQEAEVIAYQGTGTDIVLTGTSQCIDKNWSANSMQSYNKEGSLQLPRGQSMSIHHIGSTVAGIAYARISFYMIDNHL